MQYHYNVRDYLAGLRIGRFTDKSKAEKLAKEYADKGIYTIVECYDNSTKNKLANLVYSSNEQNWRGANGNWNTNA